MTMSVVFLKDYSGYRMDKTKTFYDFKVLDEAYVPRKLGQKLVFQEIAIPTFRKELNSEYRKLLKEKKKKKKADAKPKKKTRKKAVSKKAETREMAITE